MRIDDAIATLRPFFSFEFFPPKDDDGVEALFETSRRSHRCVRRSFRSPTARAARRAPARSRSPSTSSARRIDVSPTSLVSGTARRSCARSSPTRSATASKTCSRCAATRRRATPPSIRCPGVLARERADRHARARLRFLHRRRVLSGEASRSAEPRADLDASRRKGRRRRRLSHLAAVLRQRAVLRVRARARARGNHAPIFPGSCRSRTSIRSSASRRCAARRFRPNCASRWKCAQGRTRAVEELGVAYAAMQAVGLLQARGAGNSLLHAQSVAGDARDRLVAPRCKRLAALRYHVVEARNAF